MRMKEITPYINLRSIKTDTLRDLLNVLRGWGNPNQSEDWLAAQYGDELHDLRIAQARLDLLRTKADIGKARAETISHLSDASRNAMNPPHRDQP